MFWALQNHSKSISQVNIKKPTPFISYIDGVVNLLILYILKHS